MGWVTYSINRGIGHGPQLFADDPLIRFFIDMGSDAHIAYIIKEPLSLGLDRDKPISEKQSSKKSYKFIIMDYDPEIVKELGAPKFIIKRFEFNHELIKYIIKYRACNIEYQRHFTINKILHEKNRS